MLRILAVWDPAELKDSFDPEDPEDLISLGAIDAAELGKERSFANRWDQRKDLDPDRDIADLGWIGEDIDGLWICIHPEIALADDQLLWRPVAQWRYSQHEVSWSDFGERSAFELEARGVMRSAASREDLRRLKDRDD